MIRAHNPVHFAVQIRFFTRLLDIRDAVHCIASRQLYSSKASVVCWVDVVLTKMGNLISIIVTEASETASTLDAPSLAELRIEQSLQAAIQMPCECACNVQLSRRADHVSRPATWDAIPGFIASDYASPAATRLALNLLYAVYILGRMSSAGDDWPSEGCLCHYFSPTNTDKQLQTIPSFRPWRSKHLYSQAW